MKILPIRWMSLLILIMAGLACKEPAPPIPVTPIKVSVEVLESCSKIVKLKDSYFLHPDTAVELAYTWNTDPEFNLLAKDYSVWAHFETGSGELIWIEDHMPSPQTTEWKPATTYRYTDIVQVPKKVADPRVSLFVGLYDRKDLNDRLYLPDSDRKPIKKIKVAQFFIQPEERELYSEGWGQVEFGADGKNSWRWISSRAKYSFRNPMRYCFLTVKGSTLIECFPEKPTVTMNLNGQMLDSTLMELATLEKSFDISPDKLGGGDWCDLELTIDKNFSPAICQHSRDERQLGMMINWIDVQEIDYTQGWFDPELTQNTAWRWCGREGIIRAGNPHSDAMLVIDGEVNLEALKALPRFEVWLGNVKIEEFSPDSDRVSNIFTVKQELWGDQDIVALTIKTDRTFKPVDAVPGSTDDRELGFRVNAIRIIPIVS